MFLVRTENERWSDCIFHVSGSLFPSHWEENLDSSPCFVRLFMLWALWTSQSLLLHSVARILASLLVFECGKIVLSWGPDCSASSPPGPCMAYSLIYLVLCLNVSEDGSLMILYKIVLSSFSKPLPYFIFVGSYLSLPESTVFYACSYTNIIYLFMCWLFDSCSRMSASRGQGMFHAHQTVPGIV